MRNCRQPAACFYCGEPGHGIANCTKVVCLKCGKPGHTALSCKLQPQDQTPNKGEVAKCLESVEAAPVLIVEGLVDGETAAVGLDSFAGVGMVAADAVADRRSEWRPSTVLLQGVAAEPVRPLGEIDLHVKLGEAGGGFVERAAICEQLPAGVDVLVGHDTLKDQGLVLERDRVLVGGQECRPVQGARPYKLGGRGDG